MRFSERVSQTEEQIQEEARKKRAAELAAKAEAAVKEQDRIEAIKNDPRYKRLVELAHSPELMEALDYIAMKHGTQGVGEIKITENLAKDSNHPVGWINVESTFIHSSDSETHLAIGFTWRDKATTAKHIPATYGKAGSPARTEGQDRHAGLAIELFHKGISCYTLEELLHRLAEEVAKGETPGTYWRDTSY